MRIGHDDTSPRQSIDVRRLYLRVSAIAAQPIIQVINRNEQHIWCLVCLHQSVAGDADNQCEKQGSHSGLLCEEQIDRRKC